MRRRRSRDSGGSILAVAPGNDRERRGRERPLQSQRSVHVALEPGIEVGWVRQDHRHRLRVPWPHNVIRRRRQKPIERVFAVDRVLLGAARPGPTTPDAGEREQRAVLGQGEPRPLLSPRCRIG